MLLYSIVDIADVMGEIPHNSRNDNANIRKIKGGFIELDNSVKGISRVKRLYSTNPALYLDKRYYPF